LFKRDVRTSSDGRNMVRFALLRTIEIALAYECYHVMFSEDVLENTRIRRNTVISLY